MKKCMTHAMVVLFGAIAVSIAATPDKAAMEGKEKAAWQAFKDKNEAEFKKWIRISAAFTTLASRIWPRNWTP